MQNNHVRYLYSEVNRVFVGKMRECASWVSCCAPGTVRYTSGNDHKIVVYVHIASCGSFLFDMRPNKSMLLAQRTCVLKIYYANSSCAAPKIYFYRFTSTIANT